MVSSIEDMKNIEVKRQAKKMKRKKSINYINKKGSHAGIIISFVIFITSLLFIFSVIGSPFDVGADKKDSINFLNNKILEMVSEPVAIIRVNDLSNEICTEINLPIGFTGTEVLAVNGNGYEVDALISGTKVIIPPALGFTKIYYSNEGLIPTKNSPETNNCDSSIASSVSIDSFMMESKFAPLVTRVTNDYDALKTELEINLDDDFNIAFELSDGTNINNTQRERPTDIFAKEYVIRYISTDGKEESGKMLLKIW